MVPAEPVTLALEAHVRVIGALSRLGELAEATGLVVPVAGGVEIHPRGAEDLLRR